MSRAEARLAEARLFTLKAFGVQNASGALILPARERTRLIGSQNLKVVPSSHENWSHKQVVRTLNALNNAGLLLDPF
jgi:hypothetical protein